MGSRNPNRHPFHERVSGKETVATMLADGWQIVTRCATCGLRLRTPLRPILRLAGRNCTLWDRHPRCRTVGCLGRVTFFATIPRCPGEYPLVHRRSFVDGRPEPLG